MTNIKDETDLSTFNKWEEIRKKGAVSYALKYGVPFVGLLVFLVSYFSINPEEAISTTTLILLLISGAFGFFIGLCGYWGMENRFKLSAKYSGIQAELSKIGEEIELVSKNEALTEEQKNTLYAELDQKMESLLKKMN